MLQSVCIIPENDIECICCMRQQMERESGGNPERSGHCIWGATFLIPLYARHMRRENGVRIHEPGNLLCV